jgi:hypothetical protein
LRDLGGQGLEELLLTLDAPEVVVNLAHADEPQRVAPAEPLTTCGQIDAGVAVRDGPVEADPHAIGGVHDVAKSQEVDLDGMADRQV